VARKCVFCEREVPLTLEHVFPSWISSVLMPAESVVHIHRLEGEVVRAHTSAKMDATVKRVCERCNNGWMHELEEAARPVLTPLIRKTQPRGLAPIEQEVISTWAIKTALMCEFMDPRSASAPRSHFQVLFQSLKPPPGTNVWIAAYAGHELRCGRRLTRFIRGHAPGTNGPKGVVAKSVQYHHGELEIPAGKPRPATSLQPPPCACSSPADYLFSQAVLGTQARCER
jgi:hypothetical protein